MNRIRQYVRRAFTPVTIMLIPHSNSRPLNFKIPSIGIIFSVLMWMVGTIYLFSVAVSVIEYRMMEQKLNYYSGEFHQLKSTIKALKRAEWEFSRLFSLGTKEKVLESVNGAESGSIDIEALRGQIKNTVETVTEIREYLMQQKDIYLSTPKGWPVAGRVTSAYGKRENPVHGGDDFHSGIDIAADPGTPIRATAEGVVSFSGWSGGSGNLVGLEHGFGYATFYAHNKTNAVKVGQRVKKGDIVAYAGSTGNTTGPHSHYEIWKDGRHVDPKLFMDGRN